METGRHWIKRLARAVLASTAALAMGLALAQEAEFKAGEEAWSKGDVFTAMTLLKKPADANYAPAQSLLAYILHKVESNEEAVAYFRKAAEQNHAEGQFGLASMYNTGEGVKRDPVEARKWFTRAAEKGHEPAIRALAHAYIRGGLGIEENERTGPVAMQWIKRAAQSDFVPSLEYLAKAHRTGGMGVELDIKEAERLDARVKTLTRIEDKKGRKKR